MARTPKLKVFRTPIGFHDAYVAAPSQKAALKAWGSDRDLFARGAAERVEDPELMRDPLEHPGQVIRRSRGTAAEQIAALPKSRHAPQPATDRSPSPSDVQTGPSRRAKKQHTKRKAQVKITPRPSRAQLEAAERTLAQATARQNREQAELKRREAALARERLRIEKKHAAEHAKLERAVARARQDYERALRAWQG